MECWTSPKTVSVAIFLRNIVLVELMLVGNLFTGLIPPKLSMLMNLSSLDLSSNQFNGEHSSRARRCAPIARIDLAFNKLSGPDSSRAMQSCELGEDDFDCAVKGSDNYHKEL